VATFRRDIREGEISEDMPPGDNLWGTPEEDAKRRDFTINALFYDPVSDKLIDFAKGKSDLDEGIIRIIGDPQKRIHEDPIRILRAIRLSHMIRFSLENDLRKAIAANASSLETSALPRRREELLKFLRLKEPLLPLLDCYDLGVLKAISPTLHEILSKPESKREFVSYMRAFHDYYVDSESPLDLFSILCLAVIRSQTVHLGESLDESSYLDLIEKQKFTNFMKFELGMFNYEQAAFVKAMQLIPSLTRLENLEKRGPKRRSSMLRNVAYSLALALAKRDHCLTTKQILYWTHEIGVMRSNYNEAEDENSFENRERRPRRRRRTKKHLAKS
jgi:poly(A) polymerase